jgi:hypothetical protein
LVLLVQQVYRVQAEVLVQLVPLALQVQMVSHQLLQAQTSQSAAQLAM